MCYQHACNTIAGSAANFIVAQVHCQPSSQNLFLSVCLQVEFHILAGSQVANNT